MAVSANQISAEMELGERPTRTQVMHSKLRIAYLLQTNRPKIIAQWWAAVTDASKVLEKRDIEITFTDEENNPVRGWRLKNAWPCRIGLTPMTRFASSRNATEFVDFTYEEIESREHLSQRRKVSKKQIKGSGPLTEKQRDAFFGKKLQSDRARELWDEVDKLDVSTKYGEAMLYSGTRKTAEKYAAENGFKTLESTPGGKWLDAQQLFKDPNISNRDAQKIWRKLSKRYAKQASGPVKIFEGTRDYRRMRLSTLRSVEMGVLKGNKAVNLVDYRLFSGAL